MFRYLCPAAISKTHSCPHFLMKPPISMYYFSMEREIWYLFWIN